jgi:hypothetical protein
MSRTVAKDSNQSGQQILCCGDYTESTYTRANRAQLGLRANPNSIRGCGWPAFSMEDER